MERDECARLLEQVNAGEAMPHLREIALRDVPASLRIDLKSSSFDGMRAMRAFRELETEVSQRLPAKQ